VKIEQIIGLDVCRTLTQIARSDLDSSIRESGLNQSFDPRLVFFRIQELERPHISKLQEFAQSWVREAFQISESEIELKPQLLESGKISLHPDQNLDERTVTSKQKLPPEIVLEFKKRRLINTLIAGAGHACQNIYQLKNADLDLISEYLLPNYRKLMALAENQYWKLPDTILKQLQMQQRSAGIVRLETKEDGFITIEAQGVILPTLLLELGKGVMQTIARHGLPTDSKTRQIVKDLADNLDFELEETKLGRSFYRALLRSRNKQENSMRLVDFLYSIVKLSPQDLIDRMGRAIKSY
jgi:hypothetical protein